MPQPTLAELRTARALLRQQIATANDPSRSFKLTAIQHLDAQIAELEGKEEPTYGISQDGIGSFILTHKSGFPRYAICPCCDKPILTLERAKILASNLQQLDERVSSLQHEPKET